jgi:hypothetical protein
MSSVPRLKRDWGESSALLVAVIMFFVLRDRYTVGGPVVTTVFGILAAATWVASLAATFAGSRRASRVVMLAAAAVLAVALVASMTNIVYLVVYRSSDIQGTRLLESALGIWVSNVIIFAVIYHWIGDREFVFPRREDEEQRLVFLDYLFLSFTTSTAFSPTDTPPLTTRSRMFMMLESAISLTTIAIAAARAVNILS